jgi:hypothetical protein
MTHQMNFPAVAQVHCEELSSAGDVVRRQDTMMCIFP